MIPIELTLQGLYSYQAKQTIDFTRLTAAGLFGIFGTVGSGKSSILEAITFALYGRTDRLNLSGDNRNYNMMNLKSGELLIDFIFETGSEQTAYRSTVRGRRNSRRFEEVKTLERAVYRKVNDEWLPIEQEALVEAIGLSYENFKRTIIIPQGQFQEFLQLGNKDRTQMLKELFNLEKYEFFYKVVSLETKNNAQMQHLGGQLQQLGEIDPEQVNLRQAQLQKLEEAIEAKNRVLGELQQKEEQLRTLQELIHKRDEAVKELRELGQQEPAYKSLEKRIGRYEQCLYLFKHQLDLLKERDRKREERAAQIRDDRKRLQEEEAEIERIEKLIGELRPAYEKRDELQKKAAELALLVQMKRVEENIAGEEIRLRSGTDFLDKAMRQADKLKTGKQQLEGLIRELRNKTPDLALLSAIRSWHSDHKNLCQLLLDGERELIKYTRQEKELLEERSLLLSDPLFEKLPHDAGYRECEGFLEKETAKVKELQRLQAVEENHLRVKEQLKSYASDLEEGKPCPLCGSTHHPERYKSDDHGRQLQHIEEGKHALELKLTHTASLSRKLTLLESRQEQILQSKSEWSEKSNRLNRKMTDHEGQFIWEKYRDEEQLNAAFVEAKEIQEALREHEKALSLATSQLEQEEKNRERYRSELEKIRTVRTVHETTLSTLGQQLRLITPEQYRQTAVKEIEEEKQRLLQEHQRIEKRYVENIDLLQERVRKRDGLTGALRINSRELEQEQAAIDSLQKQLDEALVKSSFRDLEEVSLILAEAMDLEAEKKKLATFSDHLLRCKSALEQLQKAIGERVYDEEAHGKLLTDINALREEVTEKNREQGEITGLLRKLQEDLQSMASLRAELGKLEVRAENIRTMKSLFKASGFVNYISTVYLQNLCNAANDRFFRLTRQKLSLEITADNNFQVRDFMNDGKVRSVKTLSGGQTFQASLSLALSLADNIQQITRSNQNFFFLDEGFGSLDKESLDVVFDTLKTLRRENRIVGVISHVEEMQQEIEAHLRIENDPERGSLIRRSWEE